MRSSYPLWSLQKQYQNPLPLQKQYQNLNQLLLWNYFNHISAIYVPNLTISHQYINQILSISRPCFSHLNLGKVWKSRPQNSLHCEYYLYKCLKLKNIPIWSGGGSTFLKNVWNSKCPKCWRGGGVNPNWDIVPNLLRLSLYPDS